MAKPKTPLLTVDCVIYDRQGRVLLIRRKNPPFQGAFALPGGFVEIGETVEDACRREVMEETGLKVTKLRLAGVYSAPGRDPRGHTCSVVYLAERWSGKPEASDDAADAQWVTDWRSESLAFDHSAVLADAEVLRASPAPEKRKRPAR